MDLLLSRRRISAASVDATPYKIVYIHTVADAAAATLQVRQTIGKQRQHEP